MQKYKSKFKNEFQGKGKKNNTNNSLVLLVRGWENFTF